VVADDDLSNHSWILSFGLDPLPKTLQSWRFLEPEGSSEQGNSPATSRSARIEKR
jgi:hypothetical protein